MLLLGQALWIILILYTDSFLPMGCEAAIENKQMKMGDKDNLHTFASKPKRRLLDWHDTRDVYSYHTDYTYIIVVVVVVVIVLIASLIKCCIKFSDDTDDFSSNTIVHPPPRNHFIPSQRTSSMRPLAPPMTSSRSLILSPEEGLFQPYHIGIENPNYVTTNSTTDPLPSYTTLQPKSSNNPTTELPPSYETVLVEDMLNDAGNRIGSIAAAQNSSTSPVLPTYEESRY